MFANHLQHNFFSHLTPLNKLTMESTMEKVSASMEAVRARFVSATIDNSPNENQVNANTTK